jgi:hypothetical protein
MGEKRDAYKILVGKPDGKRPLGRPRCRWLDTIKIDLAQDRDHWRALMNSIITLRVP